MAEESTQPQRGSHRGRGGRRGRYRRGHRQGPRRQESDGEASQPSPAPPTQPAQSGSVIIPSPAIAVPGSGDVVREAGNQLGRGRGGRGRRGDSRRGTGQRSIVVSHRGGRRPPPISGQRGNHTPGLELRAAASEFVPGRPIQSSRSVV
jgi:transcriptional repressor NF-X1